MLPLVIFNIVMILLSAGIATRLLPVSTYSGLLQALHITVGITTPPPEKLWIFAVAWLAIITILVDGLIVVLLLLTYMLK